MKDTLKGGYALGMSRQEILGTYQKSPHPPKDWMIDDGWCGVGFGFECSRTIRHCVFTLGIWSFLESAPHYPHGGHEYFIATPDIDTLREIYGDQRLIKVETTIGTYPKLASVTLPISHDCSISVNQLQTGGYVLNWYRENEESATTIRLSAEAAQATLEALRAVLE